MRLGIGPGVKSEVWEYSVVIITPLEPLHHMIK